MGSTAYLEGMESTTAHLHCSDLAFTAGNASYLIACGVASLIFAPLSERFGRRKTILFASILSTLCFLPQALAPDIAVIIVFRGVQGATVSVADWYAQHLCIVRLLTGSCDSVVGGMVADLWVANGRGMPMSAYIFSLFVGQSLGSVIFGDFHDVLLRTLI